tara:strand:+ start:88110 stop:89657 length:1548 start_codon:yes stop_codon:yes gene_type:complete
VALITVSCQKDDELKQVTTNTENKSGLIFKTLNKTEVVSNSLIKQKLNTLNKKPISNVVNRDVYVEGYDFTISTDGVNYIETENGAYHSYTFKIKRANSNGLLENLIFSLQPDGSYKTVLVNYQLTPDQVNKLEQYLPISLINNTISSTVLDDDNLTLNLLAKETLVADFEAGCLTLFEQICDCNQHTAETGYSACNCYRQVAWQHCMDDNSGGTSDDSTGDNDSDIGSGIITDGTTGGSQTPDTTNDYDPTDPSIHGDNNVLSNPNYDEPAVDKNCKDLKRVGNSPYLASESIALENNLNQNAESGFGIRATNTFPYLDSYPLVSDSFESLIKPRNAAVFAASHNHFKDTFEMFGHGDIATLYSLSQTFDFDLYNTIDENGNGIGDPLTYDLSSITFFLVVTDNTYAIKIDDITKLATVQQHYINGTATVEFANELEKVYKKVNVDSNGVQRENPGEADQDKLAEAFIKFVSETYDFGISLYTSTNDDAQSNASNNWKKLTLDADGKLLKQNCN